MGTSSPLLPNVFSMLLLHYALWLCLAISSLPNVFTINISILPLSVSVVTLPSGNTTTCRNAQRHLKKNNRKRILGAMQTNTQQQQSGLSMSLTCEVNNRKQTINNYFLSFQPETVILPIRYVLLEPRNRLKWTSTQAASNLGSMLMSIWNCSSLKGH